mgnify:CR=1 FL=1
MVFIPERRSRRNNTWRKSILICSRSFLNSQQRTRQGASDFRRLRSEFRRSKLSCPTLPACDQLLFPFPLSAVPGDPSLLSSPWRADATLLLNVNTAARIPSSLGPSSCGVDTPFINIFVGVRSYVKLKGEAEASDEDKI